jgi:hypothetical protein
MDGLSRAVGGKLLITCSEIYRAHLYRFISSEFLQAAVFARTRRESADDKRNRFSMFEEVPKLGGSGTVFRLGTEQ